MKLNSAQTQAVKHDGRPLLIIAGAGTGKTTVITKRIKHLIEVRHINPYHIFAATFTEKATEEMKARLDTVMPFGYLEPWLGTFHGLCERLLQIEGLEIGLNPNFKILTQTDQWIFLREHLYQFDFNYYRPVSNPTKFISALIKFFSRLADEDISTHVFDELVSRKTKQAKTPEEQFAATRLSELNSAYQQYQQHKRENNFVDFGDLITLTLKLLRDRPNIKSKYQQQFSHILVDEFQDTNFAQFELIKLLAPPQNHPNLTVVGDDDQCLPPGTKIITNNGQKNIADIKQGDLVLSGTGKGCTSFVPVTRVMKSTKNARFLTITTSSDASITATDNHKMFCYIKRQPKIKSYYYVYLMNQRSKGWRIGITNDLCVRLSLERHADSIIAIKSCATQQEARYFEMLYSLKYCIPTTVFSARPNTAIVGVWLDKLLREIDTQTSVEKLAKDLCIDLHAPHVMPSGITRDTAARIKINVYLCHRNYSSKTSRDGYMPKPLISHVVHMETSNTEAIKKLTRLNIHFTKAKKGIRIRKQVIDLQEALKFAKQLEVITGGFIDEQASLARENTQSVKGRIIPAKNLQLGMYIPVLKGKKLIYEQIINISEKTKKETVYDLEVVPTHNYIADSIAVHNSIYKFRGASVSNILEFKEIYPDAREIILSQNYRSTQGILDAAYQSIIQNNPDRLEVKLGLNKKLISQIEGDIQPITLQFSSVDEEVNWTINQIIELVSKHTISYKDIAIVARANSQLEPYVHALRLKGLPYQLVANHGLFDQEEIKTLLTFVKVLADPTDTLSLFQLSQAQVFSLDPKKILAHIQEAKVKSGALWDELKQESDEKTVKLVSTITDYQSLAGEKTISQILYQFINQSGYLKPLIEIESIENQLKIKNLNLFFNQLKRFEMSSPDKSIVGFLNSLELWLEAGENPGQSQIEDIDTISVMTIHAAKGLEFEAVFVGSLVAGRFPSNSKKDPIEVPGELIKEVLPEGDAHIQEERRLFYVALTRAKHFLYLTFSENVGGMRKRKMSGFINETKLPMGNLTTKPELSPLQSPALPPIPKYLSGGKYDIDTVSYSQIDTFDACPLKYKYRYLLQIPAKSHHSLSFGRTIHQTLYQLHLQEMHGKSVELDALLNTYNKNFIEEGYENATHKQQRYEKGKESIIAYFHHYHELFGRPILLEQSFQFKLKTATLVGKIDRIDEIADGKHEIIDYKTGAHKDQKHADKDEQLTIYALAAKEVLHIPISQMSLYFIETSEDGKTGEKITTTRSEAQLIEARVKLEKRIETMQVSDFPAKPDPVKCGFCEYNSLCPFASKKK